MPAVVHLRDVRPPRWQRRRARGLACAVLLTLTAARSDAADPNAPTPRHQDVLVLHSYPRGTIYTELQEEAIRAALLVRREGRFRPSITYEYLGWTPPPGESRDRLHAVIAERMRSGVPDLILTTDTPALEFAVEYAERTDPNLPIVFSAATRVDDELRQRHAQLTGVVETIDAAGTMDLALTLFPQRTHCVAITDDVGYGRMLRARADAAARERSERMTIEWLAPVRLGEIRDRLQNLKPTEFVLLCTSAYFTTRAQGVTDSDVEQLCRVARGPVFTIFDIYLGEGVVGGKVTSAEYYGGTAARLALRVLEGEPASTIPIVRDDTTVHMFDWRALRRWGVDEAALPPRSVVRYRVPNFLEEHRWYVLAGAGIVAAQTLTIALLMLHRVRLVRSRRALQESRERYLLASSAATVYVWEWDIAKNTTYIDPSFLEHLGHSDMGASPTPEQWWGLLHPDDLAHSIKLTRAQSAGDLDRVESEFRYRTAAGDYRWFLARGQRVGGKADHRVVGTIVDIHRIKQTEDALRDAQAVLEARVQERTAELILANESLRQQIAEREHAQTALRESEQQMRQQADALAHVSRVAMVGEMAAGLAHEINQPLTAATNHAEASILAIKSQSATPAELLSDLETIAEQTTRVGQIVRNLRGFVSNRNERRALASVGGLLADVVRLAEMDLRRSGVRLELSVAGDLPPIFANDVQIQQVVLNLVRNAIEAMSELPTADRQIRLTARCADADLVEVSVADRGRGVRPEERERIFDPFVTTRADGLGLGLTISRTIVERHGGRLVYRDNPGGGAVFGFTIPVARGAGTA